MTLYVKIGRRVPKNWFKRQAQKMQQLLSFQENLWLMISQSFRLQSRRCNESGYGKWLITKKDESEDLKWKLEWQIHQVVGSEKFEREEHKASLKIYEKLGNVISKKELPESNDLKKAFKTAMLSTEKLAEYYKEGYKEVEQNNVANKMLEMGILTEIEFKEDFHTREIDFIPKDY